jgi:hypothetical protein
MQTTIQRFPAVNIEALSNGLFRLEDESGIDGPASVDLHPAQVQVLASMVGFEVPDKSRRALARAASRLKALKAQVSELEGKLRYAVLEQDMDLTPEMVSAEHIGFNLGEVVKDLEDLMRPDLEPKPDAPSNQGGQLTLPV